MEKETEPKKITTRNAPHFGFLLAANFSEKLENEDIPPSKWPPKFPFTLKQIMETPEVNGNVKAGRRALETAKLVWGEMRDEAIEIERDMRLHPEYYEHFHSDHDEADHGQDWAWRHFAIELQQIAGDIFINQFPNEEEAKAGIYLSLTAQKLKQHMVNFDDDYINFINETREAIRSQKNILPSIRLELICLLGTNLKAATKIKLKPKKKSVKNS